ncbi:MAG: ABC transporter permease subunit [Planctomycetales bacterium]
MSAIADTARLKTAPARGWGRRAGRRGGGGSALVARGEPLVWLSGGALAVSLAMVAGLLALIVYRGFATFWPDRIVRLELRDGRAVMGEVSADEVHEPSPGVETRRRQVRTGNFELTNTHFQWVLDEEVAPGGVTLPEWALLVERVEWGRFYGVPQAFAVRSARPVSGEEEQLAETLRFFEEGMAKLDEADRAALTPFVDQELRPQLRAVQIRAYERLLANFGTTPEGARLDAVLASGRIVPITEVPPGEAIVEIHEVRTGAEAAWDRFAELHDGVREKAAERRRLEKHDIGALNRRLETARLAVRSAEIEIEQPLLAPAESALRLRREIATLQDRRAADRRVAESVRQRFGGESTAARAAARFAAEREAGAAGQIEKHRVELQRVQAVLDEASPGGPPVVQVFWDTAAAVAVQTAEIQEQIQAIRAETARYELRLATADGRLKALSLADVVRAFPANRLGWWDRLGVYFSRWAEFLTGEPREANSEGGILPAIWGTVVMTLIMSLAVVPFGVLAALYLREYAKPGPIVSAVRISVNNLAGVPSIVFGVFGLGFFCYIIGAYVDGGPDNAGIVPWPEREWFVTLGALAAIGAGAFLLGLLSLAKAGRGHSGWQRHRGRVSIVLWLVATVLFVALIAKTPFFDGFYAANLPNPTFGKGGLLWASLTLSLLTLPVVIVATEEAVSAVPNSMREGSYACGASKWQTIRRIVLPRALPGILTGMILAMARGAGEVAPLMLVGAVKLAPELPIDGEFPFFHGSRNFMHLGFHIYDLGFQSPNSEAARPMVFTTTLLLIFIVASLNLAAIWLRGRLRRRFGSAQF